MIRTIVIEKWSVYRRLIPSDVYLWAKAFLLAAVAIQAARLLWSIATPAGPLGNWMPAAANPLAPQVQAAVLASVDPFYRSSATGAPSAAEVEVTLHGIRGDGGLGGGSAIIGLPDGTQQTIMVGEEVSPGVRLAAVYFDHVLLDLGGEKQQRLAFEGAEVATAAAAASASSGSAAPDPTVAGALTAAAIRQAVNFAPRNRDGQINGIVISPGADAAGFESAGFRSGDVVVAVNGARITSATDVAQLQSSIAPGARLVLTVERGAEAVPIALNIAGNQ